MKLGNYRFYFYYSLDVFHWDCLNARQSALPTNTAPRGHQCPICETEIFPTTNLVSPIADALKQQLVQSNWGRNGLGLALVIQKIVFTFLNFLIIYNCLAK